MSKIIENLEGIEDIELHNRYTSFVCYKMDKLSASYLIIAIYIYSFEALFIIVSIILK